MGKLYAIHIFSCMDNCLLHLWLYGQLFIRHISSCLGNCLPSRCVARCRNVNHIDIGVWDYLPDLQLGGELLPYLQLSGELFTLDLWLYRELLTIYLQPSGELFITFTAIWGTVHHRSITRWRTVYRRSMNCYTGNYS